MNKTDKQLRAWVIAWKRNRRVTSNPKFIAYVAAMGMEYFWSDDSDRIIKQAKQDATRS